MFIHSLYTPYVVYWLISFVKLWISALIGAFIVKIHLQWVVVGSIVGSVGKRG